MKPNSLLDHLRRSESDADLMLRAAEYLREAGNLCTMAREIMGGQDPERLYQTTRSWLVPNVSPTSVICHDEDGRFQIVLNHFERGDFDRHYVSGRISPHTHQFPFATRVIRGGYYHVLYDAKGDGSSSLSIGARYPCDSSIVYRLPHDCYHCVFEPEQDTVSFMVRGRRIVHLPDRSAGYTLSTFVRDWERLEKALDGAPLDIGKARDATL